MDLTFAKTILLLNLPENMFFYKLSLMWYIIENHKLVCAFIFYKKNYFVTIAPKSLIMLVTSSPMT